MCGFLFSESILTSTKLLAHHYKVSQNVILKAHPQQGSLETPRGFVAEALKWGDTGLYSQLLPSRQTILSVPHLQTRVNGSDLLYKVL